MQHIWCYAVQMSQREFQSLLLQKVTDSTAWSYMTDHMFLPSSPLVAALYIH